MPFRKFESISNEYDDDMKSKMVMFSHTHPDSKVAVTEKFHGANLSAEVEVSSRNEICVTWASRNKVISTRDFAGFYRSDIVVDKYTSKVAVLTKVSPHLTVYGEIVGGNYPTIVKWDELSPGGFPSVQKGVYYTPDIEWVVFDVFDHAKNRYWSTSEVETHMKELRIPYARALFRGTFEEAMYWSCQNFDSVTLAPFELFGLTPVEDNIKEGHVLKFDDGEGLGLIRNEFNRDERLIIKHKNDRFKEKANARSDYVYTAFDLPKHLEQIGQIARMYVVPNRLDNVISKMTCIPTKKDIGMVIRELKSDVISELVRVDYPEMSCEDTVALMNYIHPIAQAVVVDRFVK